MFDQLHHAALNTAIDDRTRLASALYRLLTATQTECSQQTVRMIQAQAEAVEALQSVGGIEAVTEPAVAEI